MRKLKTILFAIAALLFISCTTDDDTLPNQEMSIMAFIVADNDLDDHALYIEKDLISGLKSCPLGTEIVIYMDRLNQSPTLKRYTLTNDGKVGVNNIKTYSEQCSTSPSVFSSVLSDMRSIISGKRYGLIYWSHGSGWLPNEKSNSSATRAIGMDNGVSMDIIDMAKSMSKIDAASFMVLDACFMGCAPVAFELRDVMDYLIASPAELPGVGFCYSKMLPDLVKCTEQSLSNSLDLFVEANKTNVYGDSASFAIASVIKCNEMENLVRLMHEVVLSSKDAINTDEMQSFDFKTPHLYYDLGEYADSIAVDQSALSSLKVQLDKAIVKTVFTPTIWSMNQSGLISKPITIYSGLSTFIPGVTNVYYDHAFTKTSWYKEVYE